MKKIFSSLVVFISLISLPLSLKADVCVGSTITFAYEQGFEWYGYYHSPKNADGTIPPYYYSGNSLVVTYTVVGQGSVLRDVTNPDGTTTFPYTVNVVNCLAIPSLPSVLCSGNVQSLSLTDTNGSTSYTWTAPSGWSLNGGSNTLTTSSTSVSVTVANPATSGYNPITVSSNNSGTRTFNVWIGSPSFNTVYESLHPNVNPISLQMNSTYLFYADANGATSYTWTVPSGYSGGTSGTSVYMTTASYPGIFVIPVTASNSCGSAYSSIQTELSDSGGQNGRKAADDGPEPLEDEANIIFDTPYPIPSHDHININLSQPSTISMINMQGIAVRELSTEGQTIISTDDLTAGVYLFKLQNRTQLKQFKVIIHK
jgi:hypothetical protein